MKGTTRAAPEGLLLLGERRPHKGPAEPPQWDRCRDPLRIGAVLLYISRVILHNVACAPLNGGDKPGPELSRWDGVKRGGELLPLDGARVPVSGKMISSVRVTRGMRAVWAVCGCTEGGGASLVHVRQDFCCEAFSW